MYHITFIEWKGFRNPSVLGLLHQKSVDITSAAFVRGTQAVIDHMREERRDTNMMSSGSRFKSNLAKHGLPKVVHWLHMKTNKSRTCFVCSLEIKIYSMKRNNNHCPCHFTTLFRDCDIGFCSNLCYGIVLYLLKVPSNTVQTKYKIYK